MAGIDQELEDEPPFRHLPDAVEHAAAGQNMRVGMPLEPHAHAPELRNFGKIVQLLLERRALQVGIRDHGANEIGRGREIGQGLVVLVGRARFDQYTAVDAGGGRIADQVFGREGAKDDRRRLPRAAQQLELPEVHVRVDDSQLGNTLATQFGPPYDPAGQPAVCRPLIP